ncbi:RNA polymerase sigma factor [Stackebrandtia nassauensis]|uniref:RNA polymerase, sigma-24 subunit, ECF subfamily n=1 Tax=Stackebrandtia nassauensis (strain DSM 44728 / CIP 108903 / NRRL B-16338 / NBRC 102104 / LLR-40K-21) TaxID=446470 RepID=D3Q6J5_STANL|nr:sigma-70 family RNA polymerase sigma factor [Stackebrandtia nassauensis]ADD44238.1 RNA polymerase, sigma-24 subunit, ECF subfamily [Stackebrandtia nassauensis DSM 44728]
MTSVTVSRIGTVWDAFEEFYREHVGSIQGFIARRVDDPHLAADLTAEVFLAAMNSAHRYRPGKGTSAGWLFGIARNVVANDRRRRARAAQIDRRISGRALVDAEDLAALDDRIDAEAQSRQLYAAMDRLSDAERAVLELVALDGLSVADAAAALRIRPTAARKRLHRARKNMRDHLAPSAPALVAASTEAL